MPPRLYFYVYARDFICKYVCNSEKIHIFAPCGTSNPAVIHMTEQGLKQQIIDKRYLRMAHIWAENSYCIRRKVGALLVKDQMIISDGYNGTPAGFPNVCEDENGSTRPYVLHAEANAITKVARSGNSSEGSTLYITASPCMECSKLIIQSGIKRVVFHELYRLSDGLDLLRNAGIDCVHVDDLE